MRRTGSTVRGVVGLVVGLVVGALGACRADERALVLDGLRAGERCAVAVLDDAGRPAKCVEAVVGTVARVTATDAGVDASDEGDR